ncbi:MAG TPA: PIN domain-containing protein [Anaeromyxobacteraceae bacterium]|nr:PIN domain-containing protein [Anaeromyxobacteraceae bacterium]
MTAAALICDTGALLDYLVKAAPDHDAFREAIDESRARFVPGLVLSEVDYFLRHEREAMAVLMEDLSRGAFTYAAPTLAMLGRAMRIDRQYADLELGLVDASVVALAEELGVYRLATRDVRHFSAVRLRGGKSFDLVVQPSRPERAKR